MDQTSTYGLVATTRSKEVWVRILLAAFVAAGALAMARDWVPVVWLVLIIAGQIIDLRISRRVIETSDHLSASLERTYLASCALNALAWGSIDIYLWLNGGPAGQWFALLVVCGGLVHASLKLYPSRAMLVACWLPHTLYLLALPLLAARMSARPDWIVTGILLAGALLYLAHMVSGALSSKAALESVRREREAAEKASAAKSEFLATVSHEIRTPMNAVLSAAHLLKRTKLTDEQADHVAMLTNAGDILMSLLNNVLDISKIEAGKMEVELGDIDLAETLEALVSLWEPQAADKGVRMRLELQDGVAVVIRTDPLRLRQILFNLMSNAVKFTDAGEVVVRAGSTGDRLWFEVADTGCGIDAEDQGRLFGSFEQASAGLSRRYGGSGLGLAISRKLAELLGGWLSLTSAPGLGSTFRLDLPLVAGEPIGRDPDVIAGSPEDTPPLSILVAEDHPVNRRILSMFLEPLGWRLTMACDGAEAVRFAQDRAFDIILMDMQMPVMDGIEATAAIRADFGPNRQTPVVALTANALGHHRDLWLAVGVAAFLTKPIDPQLLVATIMTATNRKVESRSEDAVA